MISIRGATTITEDTKQEVLNRTKELLLKIIEKNSVEIDKIISITFSCTRDIMSAYPAVAAREIGIVNAGLMCFNEMHVEGSLNMCIRVLMLIDNDLSQFQAKHIYLRGSKVLRPDLWSDD